ncbi:hypothetical protein BDP27DRAFT_1431245 [Rhodocollybia butyracea]|uniref:Uncharacterized protein n=1 Tax=Rhodocollybia butyracea TaxID=206335 RepID=A0A9P5TXJ6_9AGAR|nr:hypothetical protein BDP27DRAFT_1431245 [Rhodocollybia butyracea]
MHFTLAFVTAALVTLTVAVPAFPPTGPTQYTCADQVAPVCCTNSVVFPGGGIAGEGCADYYPSASCPSPGQVFCCQNTAFGFSAPCVAASVTHA